MALDLTDLVSSMIVAAKEVLIDGWDEIQPPAEINLFLLTQDIKSIEEKFLAVDISEDKVHKLLRMKNNTLEIGLLTVEGRSLIAVEDAINAALNVAKDTVNTALNFTLF